MYMAKTILYCSSFSSLFYNAGTTTVTSGPGLCHEAAPGLAENQSADCLRVWLLPLGFLCAGPDRTENTHVTLPSTLGQIYH